MVTFLVTPDELELLLTFSELPDVALASPEAEDALEDPTSADALEDATLSEDALSEDALSEEPPAPPPDEELVAEQPHMPKARTTNAVAQIRASNFLVGFNMMHLPLVT